MESKTDSRESIIFTGSNLNHRTFNDNESWNSLQSTILAGYFSMTSDLEEEKNLTTVNEENSIKLQEDYESEIIEDDNVLNINIDAISDDEVFFDCPMYMSPRSMREFNSPKRLKTPISEQVNSKQYLMVNPPIIFDYSTATDSGLGEEKTGALLAQIIEDFNDLENHAQSTPKLESEKKFDFTSVSSKQNLMNKNSHKKNDKSTKDNLINKNKEIINNTSRKKVDSLTAKFDKKMKSPIYRPYSPIDIANKENYFKGKYSSVVKLPRANTKLKSSVEIKSHKVAQIKEFFENCSRINDQSRYQSVETNGAIKKMALKNLSNTSKLLKKKNTNKKSPLNKIESKSTLKSMQVKKSSSHSIENIKLMSSLGTIKLIQTKNSLNTSNCPPNKSIKLSKTGKLFKTNFNNFTTSNSNNSSILSRNQLNSYSTRSSSCSSMQTDKDTSTSFTNRSKSTSDLLVNNSKLILAMEENRIARRPCLIGNQRSRLHKKTPKKVQKTSAIMQRKSFGFISSPIKPVRELRKIFSPSMALKTNQTKKQATKTLPHIIINNE